MTDWYIFADGGSPGTKLSAINRTFGVGINEIAKEHRLSDGSLAKDLVAIKRVFSFSWKCLAALDGDVADSGMGVDSLETIVNATGVYTLRVPDSSSSYDDYDCLVSRKDFNKDMVLHYPSSTKKYFDATLVMEEV